jgi:uncharacterized membrane protein
LASTRLLIVASIGTVALAAAAVFLPWQAAVLTGWDVAAASFVGWVLWIVLRKDAAGTEALAGREDDSRAAADATLLLASVASLASVGVAMVKAAHEHGAAKGAIIVVAVLSVVLAWAAVHVVFTLRYAHLYYGHDGGIEFGGAGQGDRPDYRDFAYVAFTVGMTYQVSDTDLTRKPLRHAVMVHSLLSYLFGTVVVAITINVVAGLLR